MPSKPRKKKHRSHRDRDHKTHNVRNCIHGNYQPVANRMPKERLMLMNPSAVQCTVSVEVIDDFDATRVNVLRSDKGLMSMFGVAYPEMDETPQKRRGVATTSMIHLHHKPFVAGVPIDALFSAPNTEIDGVLISYTWGYNARLKTFTWGKLEANMGVDSNVQCCLMVCESGRHLAVAFDCMVQTKAGLVSGSQIFVDFEQSVDHYLAVQNNEPAKPEIHIIDEHNVKVHGQLDKEWTFDKVVAVKESFMTTCLMNAPSLDLIVVNGCLVQPNPYRTVFVIKN